MQLRNIGINGFINRLKDYSRKFAHDWIRTRVLGVGSNHVQIGYKHYPFTVTNIFLCGRKHENNNPPNDSIFFKKVLSYLNEKIRIVGALVIEPLDFNVEVVPGRGAQVHGARLEIVQIESGRIIVAIIRMKIEQVFF